MNWVNVAIVLEIATTFTVPVKLVTIPHPTPDFWGLKVFRFC